MPAEKQPRAQPGGHNLKSAKPDWKSRFPLLGTVYTHLREGAPTFSGWGMTTRSTYPPWFLCRGERGPAAVEGFEVVQKKLKDEIKAGKFRLTQFGQDPARATRNLEGLQWRHYLVYWSARRAALQAGPGKACFAECGVCDGLTLFHATHAARKVLGKRFQAFAYDAWMAMAPKASAPSEKSLAGAYAHLCLEVTRKNLRDFSQQIIFNPGLLPGSFVSSRNPARVDWLHIDLNSAHATQACLEFFSERLSPHAVLLFDDYGWKSHQATKRVVDKWAGRVGCELLHLPTGQALGLAR